MSDLPAGFQVAAKEGDDAAKQKADWQKMLDSGIRWPLANEDNKPRCSPGNALHFFQELWKGKKIEFNDRLRLLEVDGKPQTEALVESKIFLLEEISRQPGWRVEQLRMATAEIARTSRHYHPIKRYLENCYSEWDQEPRIDKLVGSIIPCEDPTTLYHRSMENFFVGAVARQFKPGCQNDLVLVLQGGQGLFKSSFFITVANDASWHTNDIGDLGDKDAKIALAQAWIIEFAEMASMRKSDREAAKNFITTRVDNYRAPYEKVSAEYPRTCAFGATINPGEFLDDATGNRRYMVVPVSGPIDIPFLISIREQIWGEAVAKYNAGVKWYFSKEEERLQSEDGRNYETIHPWMEVIREALDATGENQVVKSHKDQWYVTTNDLLGGKCIGKPVERRTKGDEMAIADCLRSLGWIKGRRAPDAKRPPMYLPPEGWTPPVEQADFAGFGR